MKIGVYCGSFNPIHNGHINVAKWILEKEKLDKIIWVPLYKPFHKQWKRKKPQNKDMKW